VITLGTGKMPSYASQLSFDERWKVVTYVHGVLQGFNDAQQSARKEVP
jgi:mono/diheme cytochrome c family protein